MPDAVPRRNPPEFRCKVLDLRRPAGRDAAAGLLEAQVVEPVDVFEGGDLDLPGGAPWAAWFDQLGLEQPDHGLGRRIIAVPDGLDRTAGHGGGEPLGERDRGVLTLCPRDARAWLGPHSAAGR